MVCEEQILTVDDDEAPQMIDLVAGLEEEEDDQ